MTDSPLAPGQKFRFRVVSVDGRLFGASWTLFAARDAGDVYLAHREGGRWLKSSFHESGQWHFGLTAAALDLEEEPTERYLAITHERPRFADGWWHAHRITTLCSELREWPESVTTVGVDKVAIPEGASGVVVDLLLGDPGPRSDLSVSAPAQVLATIDRADGGVALLLARPYTGDAEVREVFASEVAEMLQASFPNSLGLDRGRAAIFGVDDDGFQHQVEVALERPSRA